MPERLNDLFKFSVILSSILSATEFQYFWEIWGPSIALRLSTSPYVLIVLTWLTKELYKKRIGMQSWLLYSEFCWDLLNMTVSYYLSFWWIIQAPQFPLLALVSAVPAVILSLIIRHVYNIRYRTVVGYYTSRSWRLRRLFLWLVAIIVVSVIFLILPSPTGQDP